jgi:hypothetical protein
VQQAQSGKQEHQQRAHERADGSAARNGPHFAEGVGVEEQTPQCLALEDGLDLP